MTLHITLTSLIVCDWRGRTWLANLRGGTVVPNTTGWQSQKVTCSLSPHPPPPKPKKRKKKRKKKRWLCSRKLKSRAALENSEFLDPIPIWSFIFSTHKYCIFMITDTTKNMRLLFLLLVVSQTLCNYALADQIFQANIGDNNVCHFHFSYVIKFLASGSLVIILTSIQFLKRLFFW